MIKISDRHIWFVLDKIETLRKHKPAGSLIRYTVKDVLDGKNSGNIDIAQEQLAIYELSSWGAVKILSDELFAEEKETIYKLEILANFREIHNYFSGRFGKKRSIKSAPGLTIANEDSSQLFIKYNGKVAKNPLTKREHFTHILYYIINKPKEGFRYFGDEEIFSYLDAVNKDSHLSRPFVSNKSSDSLRKSRNRHLSRIETYLHSEFPLLRQEKIWEQTTGGFNWFLK